MNCSFKKLFFFWGKKVLEIPLQYFTFHIQTDSGLDSSSNTCFLIYA